MARKKITTIEELAEGTTPPPFLGSQEDNEDICGEGSSVAERLADLIDATNAECISRIYREDLRSGRGPREFLERVDSFCDEEYLAENFGGGRYVIRYEYKENGQRKKTTIPFIISDSYKAKTAAPVPVQGVQKTDALGAFLGNLTAEKIGGIMAAIQGIKAIFAPPPPPVDMTELIKALATPRGPSVGDAVLIKALEGVNRPAPAPAPSILQQIKEINEVKDILGASNDAGGNDSMDKFINMGLQMLPMLLQRNGGNYQAAGAAVKENPFINGLIEKDPELLSRFCAATADKYGDQAARELAEGFGYSYESTAQAQAEPQQIETQTAEAPKG